MYKRALLQGRWMVTFMPVSGFRSDGDIYYAVGRTGGFWSSSSIDSDDNAWAWRVAYDKNGIYIR